MNELRWFRALNCNGVASLQYLNENGHWHAVPFVDEPIPIAEIQPSVEQLRSLITNNGSASIVAFLRLLCPEYKIEHPGTWYEIIYVPEHLVSTVHAFVDYHRFAGGRYEIKSL